ncbi:MAG: hypothetical protein ABI579_00355 [Candidatus Sumerlaeota bacterium]
MRQKLLPTIALFSAIALAGCDDEQILYKTKSKETIPPVSQGVPAASEQDDPHASLGGVVPGMSAPEPVNFSATPLQETALQHSWAGVELFIPARFAEDKSVGGMRVGQFSVPSKLDGDSSKGEFVIFYFGKDQGGSVADNVGRWSRQFTLPVGKTTPVTRFEHGHINNFEISRITMEGTYSAGAMAPGAAKPEPLENWALDAFVIEGGPQGNLYIRLTGPQDLVRSEKETITGIIASATEADRKTGEKGTPIVPLADDAIRLPSASTSPVSPAASKAPGVDFTVPSDWIQLAPTSSMRATQYQIPGDAEFVVFYFGTGGGGTVSDNFDRWTAQMKQPDGTDTRGKAETETKKIGDLVVNSLYMEGTYAPTAMGPGAPKPEPKPDQGFIGLVIEGGAKGTLYARIAGPAATVRNLRATMNDTVLPSLKKTP